MQKIGIWLPTTAPPEELPRFAKMAEDLGYDSVWASEGRHGDQFSILTACALATNTIKLGTNISSIFVRSAPLIGMAAATVDTFSNGRFILGLGTDHAEQVVNMHGLEYAKPIARMRDTVEIVRQLYRTQVVEHKGEVIDIEYFDMWFKPPISTPTIYIAGLFPKMLETGGAIGDGIITFNHVAASIPGIRASVTKGAQDAGRNPDDVVISLMLTCSVGEDRDEARNRMRQYVSTPQRTRMPRYGRVREEEGFGDVWGAMVDALNDGDRDRAALAVTDEYLDAYYLTGTPAECRDRLQAFIDAGVDYPIIGNAGKPEDAIALMHTFAPAHFA